MKEHLSLIAAIGLGVPLATTLEYTWYGTVVLCIGLYAFFTMIGG